MAVARASKRGVPYRTLRDCTAKVLLLEDSVSIVAAVKAGLQEETGAEIIHCPTLGGAERILAAGEASFAITGLSLPDAPGSAILDRLEQASLPALVFTALQDEGAESPFTERRLLDHVVNDGADAVHRLVRLARRIIENAAFSVLVVDDARSARSGLVDLLSRRQFRVFEARSGKEALEIMAKRPDIDMVITDYHMPDMDGYQLTQRIRAEKSAEELCILGVSSSSDRRLSTLFLKAGASDFIYRPFVAEELQCRIENNIETLKQFRRLKYFAERDPLTGLSNRRHFFERGLRMFHDNEKAGRPSAVAILDVDFFKKVNDTYGHETGDMVLKAIAGQLSELAGSGRHLVGRLGGEEFALYLQGFSGRSAYDFCNRLRERIASLDIAVHGRVLNVTASLGVADVQPGETFDNHLNAADPSLDAAKHRGRNRVFCEGVLTEKF